MKIALVLAACLVTSQTCPDLSVVNPFDMAKFVGSWYTQKATLGVIINQAFSSCTQDQYTLNSTTGVVSVVNTQKTLFNTIDTVEGSAVLADSSKTEGNLYITLYKGAGEEISLKSVLATDYDNFAILYSCVPVQGQPFESLWVVTRTQELEGEEEVEVEALIAAALNTISRQGGPRQENLYTISQKNC